MKPAGNPSKDLENLIQTLGSEKRVPTLLLHSCCAPCSTYCLEYLSDYFKITVLYYNPNIFPPEEYEFRKKEQQEFIQKFPFCHPVDFLEIGYNHNEFLDMAKGLESEPERGSRCVKCYEQRLKKCSQMATDGNYDYFATTLTISPQKSSRVLNQVGTLVQIPGGSLYLPTDFKKKNGYLRSTQISKEYNMYRQNFCGCEFSRTNQ